MAMDRRTFLKLGAAGAGATALGPGFWTKVFAAPAQPGPSPYGPLLPPDANGIRLPAHFSSRVVARGGEPVGNTQYPWHLAPDGGAVFPTADRGWIYVSNSELPVEGGASAIRFSRGGDIVGAHRILAGTSVNCAGGPTPWGTWLSCEEHDQGQVWECDPASLRPVLRRAMGSFAHEAAAVDPVGRRVYLTEDKPDSRFYRFTPNVYPDLSAGLLEAMVVGPGDPLAGPVPVSWLPVPDPNPTPASTPTRTQVPATTAFRGGEGAWFDSGSVYFTTKGDNRVWRHDTVAGALEVIYDAAAAGGGPLSGVDNVTMTPLGDLLVAEDGGDMQLVLITADRIVSPLLQVVNQSHSEITGPAFDPSGRRLYFSSQRGPAQTVPGGGQGPGITYEVSGPFRRRRR